MDRTRFAKAVAALNPNQGKNQQQPSQQTNIVRIVMSVEEDNAIQAIQQRQKEIEEKINKSTQNVNTLKQMAISNESEINEVRKEIINQVNQRMDVLVNKSNDEIKGKEQKINGHVMTLKEYKKSLSDANLRCDEMLTDQNMDKGKRKTKITKLSKEIVNRNMKNLEIIPKVKVKMDKDTLMQSIANFGNIASFITAPRLTVKDITETTATVKYFCVLGDIYFDLICFVNIPIQVKFNNIKQDYECVVELKQDSKSNDDEKIDNEWKQIRSAFNAKEYVIRNLEDGKAYALRAKYQNTKNKAGYGLYCDTKTFKTSLVVFIFFHIISVNPSFPE